jgi:hypothetical protein
MALIIKREVGTYFKISLTPQSIIDGNELLDYDRPAHRLHDYYIYER